MTCCLAAGPPGSGLVEHVECGAVGVVAEVVQVAGGDLDGAVAEPCLNGGQGYASDEPFTGRGMPQIVKSAPAPCGLPITGTR